MNYEWARGRIGPWGTTLMIFIPFFSYIKGAILTTMLATRNFSSKSEEHLFHFSRLIFTSSLELDYDNNLQHWNLCWAIFLSSSPAFESMKYKKVKLIFVCVLCFVSLLVPPLGKSMITKKGDGSQVKEKESTDSSTTIEDDEVKGELDATQMFIMSYLFSIFFWESSIFVNSSYRCIIITSLYRIFI